VLCAASAYYKVMEWKCGGLGVDGSWSRVCVRVFFFQ
jgi:hypothetical protein